MHFSLLPILRDRTSFLFCSAGLLALLAPASSAQTQLQRTIPHAGYVYPAGGRQGSTFITTVGGQTLEGVTEAIFSGPGIQAKIANFTRPLTQKEINDLREQVDKLVERKRLAIGGTAPQSTVKTGGASAAQQATPQSSTPQSQKALAASQTPETLQSAAAAQAPVTTPTAATASPSAPGKAPNPGPATPPAADTPPPPAETAKPTWTPDDEKNLVALRAQLEKSRLNRQGNPAIAETLTLEITLAAGATPGDHEIRLRAPTGISNPLVFCVGQLQEFTKPPVERTATTSRVPQTPQSDKQPAVRDITLPAVINGQMMPGMADRFQFVARRGQRIVAAVGVRALIPYLADAVPGWFQATLALYDAKGREVAYDDRFRFNPDPVLSYEIPADGNYTLEVRDSIYRGREDFVYRVTVGELPFVTGIFPLGGRHGTSIPVELSGWNLPSRRTVMDTSDKQPGVFLLAVRQGDLLSNQVSFSIDEDAECMETEPNDKPEAAQPIVLPTNVNGRIDHPGDTDVFRFSGRVGDEIVAEVFSRRLDSPLDSVLKLTDATGRQLAFNDDNEDKGDGLSTHHADSRLSLKLPADGAYLLSIGDTQHQGGSEYAYRLHVGPPRPDFALRIVPSSINVRGGQTVPVTAYALRKDGFTGEIALGLASASDAFLLGGARIPANQDKIRFTLTSTAIPKAEPYSLVLVGRATISGKPVTHIAVPAEDMMQAFAYRHLVPSRQLLVNVSSRGAGRSGIRILSDMPLRIPAGGISRLQVALPAAKSYPGIQVEIDDPPEGLTVQKASFVGDALGIVFACDAAKAKAPLQGNLILTVYGEREGDKTKGQAKQRIALPQLPAIPFEILPAQTP